MGGKNPGCVEGTGDSEFPDEVASCRHKGHFGGAVQLFPGVKGLPFSLISTSLPANPSE